VHESDSKTFRYCRRCCGKCTLNDIQLTTGQLSSLAASHKGGRISQDRSCGEVGQCRHNTARLNSDGRMGIWGLTLVRLHQASKPYLEIAAISRASSGLSQRIVPNSSSGSPRLTTAYKTNVPLSQIRDEVRSVAAKLSAGSAN